MFFLILLILLLIAILYNYKKSQDNFSAIGAMQQLYAKDDQDSYLTLYNEKYLFPKLVAIQNE